QTYDFVDNTVFRVFVIAIMNKICKRNFLGCDLQGWLVYDRLVTVLALIVTRLFGPLVTKLLLALITRLLRAFITVLLGALTSLLIATFIVSLSVIVDTIVFQALVSRLLTVFSVDDIKSARYASFLTSITSLGIFAIYDIVRSLVPNNDVAVTVIV